MPSSAEPGAVEPHPGSVERPRSGESALLERFQEAPEAQRSDLFRQLVEPHLQAMLALGRRQLPAGLAAEDVVQDVLVRAYRGLGSFRGDASVRTWLLRITLRTAASARRARTPGEAWTEATPPPETREPDPASNAWQRELQGRLAAAMAGLPERQRAALHLRTAEGMDYRCIGEVLECSSGAARMLVMTARRGVLETMGKDLDP